MRPYAPNCSLARSIVTYSRGDRYFHRWGKRNGSRRHDRFREFETAARADARKELRSEVKAYLATQDEGAVLLTDAQIRHEFGTHGHWKKIKNPPKHKDRFYAFALPDEYVDHSQYDMDEDWLADHYSAPDDDPWYDDLDPDPRCRSCGRMLDLCFCDDSYEEPSDSWDYDRCLYCGNTYSQCLCAGDANFDHGTAWRRSPYIDKLSDLLWQEYEIDHMTPTWLMWWDRLNTEEIVQIEYMEKTGKMMHEDLCCCCECEQDILNAVNAA